MPANTATSRLLDATPTSRRKQASEIQISLPNEIGHVSRGRTRLGALLSVHIRLGHLAACVQTTEGGTGSYPVVRSQVRVTRVVSKLTTDMAVLFLLFLSPPPSPNVVLYTVASKYNFFASHPVCSLLTQISALYTQFLLCSPKCLRFSPSFFSAHPNFCAPHPVSSLLGKQRRNWVRSADIWVRSAEIWVR